MIFCALVVCKVGPGPGDEAMSKEHLLLPIISAHAEGCFYACVRMYVMFVHVNCVM